MSTPEKVILSFSVKNPEKDSHYQIKVINEELSLGKCGEFETEDKKCIEVQNEIKFEKSIEYYFHFDKRQKIKFKFMKKIRDGPNYKVKEAERKTTLSSLITSPNGIYERELKKENLKNDIFCIKVNKIYEKKNTNKTIFDYLISGIKFLGYLAIDFSKGKNKIPFLNSIDKYKELMIKILDKVSIYVENHSFYVYGYGGKLKNVKNDNPLYQTIFNINMKNNNEVILSEQLIKTFNNCLNNVIPDKVCFSSLIRKMSKEMLISYNIIYYNILFILARELPTNDDKQETIDAFVESSYFPLTIIVICEGKNDFEVMDELYGNKIKGSSSGMDKIRNNIKCINCSKDFNGNSEKMIEWCLREISQQIIEYYNLNKCTPEQIKINSKKNDIEKSINKYKSSIWAYESRISVIPNNEFQKEDEDEMPNFSQINEESKNKKINEINKTNNMNPDVIIKKPQKKPTSFKNNEQKNENNSNNIDTPGKDQYLIPISDSIMPSYKNPFNNNNNNKNNQPNKYNNNQNLEQKYTPEGPVNTQFLKDHKNNNNYINKKDIPNPFIEKGYRITPGNSILPLINENPFQKKHEQEKFIITPKDSINPNANINYNPYQNNDKAETPHGNYIIQNQSIVQENKNIINPYNKNNKNQNNVNKNNNNNNYYNNYYGQNKINNISGQSEYNSTSNSNYSQSIKGSNMARLNNYSIDSSQIK